MKKTSAIFGLLATLVLTIGVGAYVWHSRSGGEAQSPTLKDAINAKLVQQGIPTIPADVTNVFPLPTLDPTLVARADATLAAAPTPPPLLAQCGPQAARQQLYDQYGDGGCIKIDTGWIFVSKGHKAAGLTGVFAIFDCAGGDDACVAGKEPAMGGSWNIYPPPVHGAIKILDRPRPDFFIINAGGAEICFNSTTRSYDDNVPCYH